MDAGHAGGAKILHIIRPLPLPLPVSSSSSSFSSSSSSASSSAARPRRKAILHAPPPFPARLCCACPCRVNVARGQPRSAALRACAYFTGVPSCGTRHEHARAGNKAAPLRLLYCSKAAVMAMHLAAAAPTSLQPNRLTLHSADRLLSLTSPPLALRHRGCRPASRPAICRHHDGFLGHAQLHRPHPRREVDGAQRFA